MQANRIVSIYSKDALVIFNIKLNKRNLLESAIKKIATLQNKSKQNELVATKKINDINEEIAKKLVNITRDLKKLKSKLRKLSINENNTKIKPLKTAQFTFGNSPILNILRLVEFYDQYFAYLGISKSTSIFNSNTEIKKIKNIKKKELFMLLSSIAFTSTKTTSVTN